MADDQKDFLESFEALAHHGEPDEQLPVARWRGFVDGAIKHLIKKMTDIELRLKELDQPGHTVVEVVIAKLEPGPDDVVVFWFPAGVTQAKMQAIYNDFERVIGGRFRFLVLVRQAVEIEIIGGKVSKGGVILPS